MSGTVPKELCNKKGLKKSRPFLLQNKCFLNYSITTLAE